MENSISITPERWHQVQELYYEALKLEGQARIDFVVIKCGNDHSLREQVLALLTTRNNEGQFEWQVEDTIAGVVSYNAELQPGQQIGRYRIERLIGRGGMGAVYLAARADEQFEQRVAIKVVADGVLSNRIVARLRGERQILANLNHPNIARLLDGGATSEGLPYLAMEYVDGSRIDFYCDNKNLSIAQRLALFQKVCAAVQYAHRHLVVHRDIKPSNILITNEGVPKLLDFGIAKLIDPGVTTQDAALTRINERMLTPEHASPEQVRGEPVTTASDVYALGVLLYELLIGKKPFELTGLSLEQMEKIICSQVPPRPSVMAMNVSRRRDSTAHASVAKQLRGDLDTIVMKALHKDVSRRYASVTALTDDIDNYLTNRPITARPDSVGYRAHKFWQRNRFATVSASMMAFTIIVLVVFYTWRLERERDKAAIEAVKSKQIADYLVGMFRAVDPREAQGQQVTALDLLNRGAAQVDLQLRDQPRVRSDLQGIIGESFASLGAYDRAQPILEESLKVKRENGLEHTRDYIATLLELANLKSYRGNFEDADKTFAQVFALQRQLPDVHGKEIALTLTDQGSLYREHERDAQSRAIDEQALSLVQADPTATALDRAVVIGNLGLTLAVQNEYVLAEKYLRESYGIRLRELGDRHPDTQISKSDLALFLSDTGRYKEALALLEELLPLRRAILGNEHPSLGILLHQIGTLHSTMGDYADAESCLQEAKTIIGNKLGTQHPQYIGVIRSIAGNDYNRGRYQAAEQGFRHAREFEVKNYGVDNPQPHRTDVKIAQVLYAQGRNREANQLLESAYHYFDGKKDVDSGRLLSDMGQMRLMQGRIDEAKQLFARELAEFTTICGADYTENSWALLGLAQVAMLQHDFDTAVTLSHRALLLRTKQLPETEITVVVAKSIYGAALLSAGKTAEAAPLIKESYAMLLKLRATNDPVVKDARARLTLLHQ